MVTDMIAKGELDASPKPSPTNPSAASAAPTRSPPPSCGCAAPPPASSSASPYPSTAAPPPTSSYTPNHPNHWLLILTSSGSRAGRNSTGTRWCHPFMSRVIEDLAPTTGRERELDVTTRSHAAAAVHRLCCFTHSVRRDAHLTRSFLPWRRTSTSSPSTCQDSETPNSFLLRLSQALPPWLGPSPSSWTSSASGHHTWSETPSAVGWRSNWLPSARPPRSPCSHRQDSGADTRRHTTEPVSKQPDGSAATHFDSFAASSIFVSDELWFSADPRPPHAHDPAASAIRDPFDGYLPRLRCDAESHLEPSTPGWAPSTLQ